MTEHTPGPWRVVPTPSGTFGKDWRTILASSTRRPVVVHGEYTTTKYGEPETVAGVQISEADAFLIAAAPALLAAAEAALRLPELWTARSTDALLYELANGVEGPMDAAHLEVVIDLRAAISQAKP